MDVNYDTDGNVLADDAPLPAAYELRPTVVADREVPAVDRNGRHFLACQRGDRLLVRRARSLGLTGPAEILAYVPISDAEAEAIDLERARRAAGPQGAFTDDQIEAVRRRAENAARWRTKGSER